MLNAVIVGASGYAGAELATYLSRHPEIKLTSLVVSAQSEDAGKPLSALYPQLRGEVDQPLLAMDDPQVLAKQHDVVFLATAHEVSHDLAPIFLDEGCTVFDLSAAFRVQDSEFYPRHYGFTHKHRAWLDKAVYGLAEWQAEKIQQAQLIAVPGCYPTAAQLALKPLLEQNLLNTDFRPVINATSGVSGAGRKAALQTSLCEVSLHAYGLFTHRHQPEIITHLGTQVIFTPHLGNFPRGILATITCQLKTAHTHEQITALFRQAYQHKPLVRIYEQGTPALRAVIGLPYCDIGFAVQDKHLILVSVEDNLLKGAAAQAVQCLNIRYGFDETLSLL